MRSPPRATFSLRLEAISPDFGQLTHGVIKGADIDVGIALDQGILETAFDLIGVEVAPVQGAKDKNSAFIL